MVKNSVHLQGQKKQIADDNCKFEKFQRELMPLKKTKKLDEEKELSLLIVGFRSKHIISLKAKVKKQAQSLQFSRRLSATSF